MRKILSASIFVLGFSVFAFGQDSNCPEISMTGPAFVPRPNETISFSVTVAEKAKDLKLKYIWSVEKGKIIEGQGTEVITVEPDSSLSTTATVEIKGLPSGCPNTVSEYLFADGAPQSKLISELQTSDIEIDSAKFDKIINASKDDLSTTVYIIIYTDEKTPPEKLKQKEKQIRKYLKDKNVLPDRIVMVNGGEGEDLIRLWLVPVGAEPPTP